MTVNERDGLGDDLPPDYFTHISQGDFFGWPYAYIGAHPDPDFGSKRPDLVAKTRTPDLLFQAHSAPLGLAFYEGDQFPADYKGDAFVALHGSWNSAKPTGYKVVRIRFKDGKPVGGYENFLTGFHLDDSSPAQVWGRPVGLAAAKDGSLLVTDDAGKADLAGGLYGEVMERQGGLPSEAARNQAVHLRQVASVDTILRRCAAKGGGAERNRTAGLLIANEALSQLSYSPKSARGAVLGSEARPVKRTAAWGRRARDPQSSPRSGSSASTLPASTSFTAMAG